MFPAANHGVGKGLLRNPDIWLQSNVIGNNAIPVVNPKIWFTATFLGNIHVTNANVLNAGNTNPGIKYQKNDPIAVYKKNLWREIPPGMASFLSCRVLINVIVALRDGHSIADE
jgi:hypothetical protein